VLIRNITLFSASFSNCHVLWLVQVSTTN